MKVFQNLSERSSRHAKQLKRVPETVTGEYNNNKQQKQYCYGLFSNTKSLFSY